MEGRDEGFLPPEPPGPEPDLGQGQAPPPPQPPQQQPPPPPQPPPPGYQQPYPQQPYPQQPGYPQTPPWQQPGYLPPLAQQYGWAPPPRQPDNSPAAIGFTLSMVSLGLLFTTAGMSSFISLGCAIFGIVYSRRGKQKIASGETQKHKDLAQVGYVGGIVLAVLSALATIFWGLILVLILTDDQVRQDFENEFDESNNISAALRLAVAGARVVLQLVC